MADPAAATPQEPVLRDALTYDPFCAVQEGLDLWFAACAVWGDYLAALSRATGPAAAFDAQARLLAESLELCGRATASRLQSAGLTAPLLNDP